MPLKCQEGSPKAPGVETTLTCSSEEDILFCAFTDPSGKTFHRQPELMNPAGRVGFGDVGHAKECAIKVSNITETDNGVWK